MATLYFQGQGNIETGSVAIDIASTAAAAVSESEVSLAGAQVGDKVVLCAPATGLTAGLVICDARVSEAGKIKVRFLNGSSGTIDESSKTFDYCLIRA